MAAPSGDTSLPSKQPSIQPWSQRAAEWGAGTLMGASQLLNRPRPGIMERINRSNKSSWELT